MRWFTWWILLNFNFVVIVDTYYRNTRQTSLFFYSFNDGALSINPFCVLEWYAHHMIQRLVAHKQNLEVMVMVVGQSKYHEYEFHIFTLRPSPVTVIRFRWRLVILLSSPTTKRSAKSSLICISLEICEIMGGILCSGRSSWTLGGG